MAVVHADWVLNVAKRPRGCEGAGPFVPHLAHFIRAVVSLAVGRGERKRRGVERRGARRGLKCARACDLLLFSGGEYTILVIYLE